MVSAVVGGPVFAAVMAAIGLGVYHEASRITPLVGLGYRLGWPGYAVVFLGASLALVSPEPWTFALLAVSALLLPSVMILQLPISNDSFATWIATIALSFYASLPIYAAIALRHEIGELEAGWANDLGDYFSLADETYALGMAWIMTAIVATWLSDTFALFIGRSLGRTPLIPHLSPKKTLEGAVGGVLGAVIGTVAFTILLGIPDISVPVAVLIGAVLAVVGILGDLTESFLKRSGGVKDSGTIIPGHGGIFDRVDAMLPIMLVTWVIVRALY